jgi:hypothetical protein
MEVLFWKNNNQEGLMCFCSVKNKDICKFCHACLIHLDRRMLSIHVTYERRKADRRKKKVFVKLDRRDE